MFPPAALPVPVLCREWLTLDGALASGVRRQQQHLASLLGGHRWALPGSASGVGCCCWVRRRLRPPPPPPGRRGEGRGAARRGLGRLEAPGGGGGSPAEHGGRRGSQLLAQPRDSQSASGPACTAPPPHEGTTGAWRNYPLRQRGRQGAWRNSPRRGATRYPPGRRLRRGEGRWLRPTSRERPRRRAARGPGRG